MKKIVTDHRFWIGVGTAVVVSHFVLPMVRARTAAKAKTN